MSLDYLTKFQKYYIYKMQNVIRYRGQKIPEVYKIMKKEKKVKVITILTVLCGIFTFISVFSSYLAKLFLFYKYNINVKDAGSVGIIGGADGPTAVFLSGRLPFQFFTAVFGVLTIFGVIYIFNVKDKKDRT